MAGYYCALHPQLFLFFFGLQGNCLFSVSKKPPTVCFIHTHSLLCPHIQQSGAIVYKLFVTCSSIRLWRPIGTTGLHTYTCISFVCHNNLDPHSCSQCCSTADTAFIYCLVVHIISLNMTKDGCLPKSTEEGCNETKWLVLTTWYVPASHTTTCHVAYHWQGTTCTQDMMPD